MKLAYMCDYCGSIFPEDEIKDHEDNCYHNPKNKTCFTCEHCLTDYSSNIKCRAKDQVSVSLMQYDLITTNCELHKEGNPTEIRYL